jgi:Fur family transcriptional regulator, zinc uptake regulator
VKTPEQRLALALKVCAELRMRVTPVRKALLIFFAAKRIPVTVETALQAAGIRGCCDATTVYRTLMMFKEADLVRLVGMPGKANYFMLNVPGDTNHFLICRRCGCVAELPLSDPMSAEMGRIASSRGFSPTSQDYEIHGLCEQCQAASKTQVKPSKLIIRAAVNPRPT